MYTQGGIRVGLHYITYFLAYISTSAYPLTQGFPRPGLSFWCEVILYQVKLASKVSENSRRGSTRRGWSGSTVLKLPKCTWSSASAGAAAGAAAAASAAAFAVCQVRQLPPRVAVWLCSKVFMHTYIYICIKNITYIRRNACTYCIKNITYIRRNACTYCNLYIYIDIYIHLKKYIYIMYIHIYNMGLHYYCILRL